MDFNWHLSESGQKRMLAPGLGLWALCMVVVSILVVRHPNAHTDCPVYVQAAQDWWAHRNMYTDTSIDGFLYFPQAAILYTPFELMGWPIGDIGWRLFGWALLCHAIYRSA